MRLIDADELNYEFPTQCKDCKFNQLCDGLSVGYTDGCLGEIAKAFIDVQPIVDPVKHGHWIFGNSLRGYAQCSECKCFTGSWDEYHADNYCSHCGALMMNEVSE